MDNRSGTNTVPSRADSPSRLPVRRHPQLGTSPVTRTSFPNARPSGWRIEAAPITCTSTSPTAAVPRSTTLARGVKSAARQTQTVAPTASSTAMATASRRRSARNRCTAMRHAIQITAMHMMPNIRIHSPRGKASVISVPCGEDWAVSLTLGETPLGPTDPQGVTDSARQCLVSRSPPETHSADSGASSEYCAPRTVTTDSPMTPMLASRSSTTVTPATHQLRISTSSSTSAGAAACASSVYSVRMTSGDGRPGHHA